MSELVSALLLFGGGFFMLVTALGLLRLPDLYTRMHAITKAGTLGVGLVFVAVAVFFGELSVVTRALAAVAFVLLTAPVSSHMIARAAYLDNVRLWEGTLLDELEGKYHRLDEAAGQQTADGGGPGKRHTPESG